MQMGKHVFHGAKAGMEKRSKEVSGMGHRLVHR